MQTVQYAAEILAELQRATTDLAEEQTERLVEAVLQSRKIFAAGAGRSGLMGKAFVMRLMQMGFEAYVVGETVTPGLDKDDILIIGSGSGGTKSLIVMAEKAKELGGTLAAVTIFPDSKIGKAADIIIRMPGSPKDQSDSRYATIQPMGALFEQTLLLFYDALILRLMEKKGMNGAAMYGRHANLE